MDTLANKKVKVSSKYGDGTQATLCATVIKAVHAVCDCMSGNVLRVSQGHLDSGAYTPNAVLAGEFTIFAKTGRVTVSAAKDSIDHKDFVGQYQLSSGRVLSVIEETLVPKLEEWYIIPEEVVGICQHALKTTGKPMQMPNRDRSTDMRVAPA